MYCSTTSFSGDDALVPGLHSKFSSISDPAFFLVKKGIQFHLTSKQEQLFQESREKTFLLPSSYSSSNPLFDLQSRIAERGIGFLLYQLHAKEGDFRNPYDACTDPNDYPIERTVYIWTNKAGTDGNYICCFGMYVIHTILPLFRHRWKQVWSKRRRQNQFSVPFRLYGWNNRFSFFVSISGGKDDDLIHLFPTVLQGPLISFLLYTKF